MDHDNVKRPNLWVKSEESFFKDIGFVPVRYSSSLKETFFAEAYQQEHGAIFLDNLNLLYVAFTRAEHGLAVFGLAGSKNSTSQLIIDSINSSPALQEKWNPKDLEWQSGEVSVAKFENQKEESFSAVLPHYPVSDWRKKLVIKKSSWSELTVVDETRTKILQGIYIHAALSNVRYANDIPSALQKLVDDGSVTLQEKTNLEKVLTAWLENPLISDWFSSHWTVQTEATVLLQDGNSVRFDRLLTQGRKARVIDFKTGNASKKDQIQVSEYCELLKTMGFQAEGYLLYLSDGEILQVGKKKAEKKKSTNQLGLDL
jgi:ATP-dependent exoDNAse (exonuclease V) beta subunit